jgi:hypothetical protein
MFDRFNPGRIITLHFAAFRDPGAVRMSRVDKSVLFLLPVVAGVGLGFAVSQGLDLRDGISQVLAATSLLVGALLSTFVFLTNLRVKLSETADFAFRANFHRLVAGSAAGCLYLAGVAFVLAGMLAGVASLPLLRSTGFQPYVAGVLLAVMVHLTINLLSVARRLFGIYFNMFAPDFDPEVDTRRDAVADKSRDRTERSSSTEGRAANGNPPK